MKLLPALIKDDKEFDSINLIIQEIPVVYDYVKTNVPALWAALKPKASN